MIFNPTTSVITQRPAMLLQAINYFTTKAFPQVATIPFSKMFLSKPASSKMAMDWALRSVM